MAQSARRPLSPHLSIWRWGPGMLVSILHRATGDGLAIVGTIGFVWWLYAIAAGSASYALFLSVATSWFGYVVMVGLSWAFFQHMASGLRHLVLDMGAGYELKTNKFWAKMTIVFSITLTIFFWAWMLVGRAA
ncbi:succinate dehydrogenase, cytochrome b556 subunit [Sphingobium sp. CR28]|uniref:succinate dehydrogenase, cytochrome b556 subunit n=1 Tax=Sphingobium sp. CR28 TaxID=3400272 RepID=UPI003FEEDD66